MYCKSLKLICFGGLLLLSQRLAAQQPLPFDGPYVRFENGQVTIKDIVKDDDLLIPKTTVYNSKKITLDVVPEGRPEWAFTVKLRDTLTIDPVTYPKTVKTLFISDIEGEFGNFRKLLLAAGVIDAHYNWTFGQNSLVIPGDLFDRSKDVVPELWLLYKLEDEARASGGSVQTLIGNHDQMNLSGDHRYTDGKYFKDAWLLHSGINGLFDGDSELGRWLRGKNTIEKTGDVLVMHGGLSPAVLAKNWSLEELNRLTRPYYDAVRRHIPDSLQVLFGKDALFWYRGYFMEPKASMVLVESTLARYNCKYILVGHTIVKWNIASYYGGRVIGVDVDEHAGNTQAALLEQGQWYVMDAEGKTRPLVYKPGNDRVKESDIL